MNTIQTAEPTNIKKNKVKWNIVLVIVIVLVAISIYVSKYNYFEQPISFVLIEILHHLIAIYAVFGMLMIDHIYNYIFHISVCIFIIIHWYVNVYILQSYDKCSVTNATRYLYKGDDEYAYTAFYKPVLKLFMPKKDRKPTKSRADNGLSTLTWFMSIIISVDIYLLLRH